MGCEGPRDRMVEEFGVGKEAKAVPRTARLRETIHGDVCEHA